MSETGLARDVDLKKAFPVGANVEVVILEVDAPAGRMRLSSQAVLQAREVEEVREYTERGENASAEGFGSLADKLRNAFTSRKP